MNNAETARRDAVEILADLECIADEDGLISITLGHAIEYLDDPIYYELRKRTRRSETAGFFGRGEGNMAKVTLRRAKEFAGAVGLGLRKSEEGTWFLVKTTEHLTRVELTEESLLDAVSTYAGGHPDYYHASLEFES